MTTLPGSHGRPTAPPSLSVPHQVAPTGVSWHRISDLKIVLNLDECLEMFSVVVTVYSI